MGSGDQGNRTLAEQPHSPTVDAEAEVEVRCPHCNYFLLQRIFMEGKAIIKMICKSCKTRVLVTFSSSSVDARAA